MKKRFFVTVLVLVFLTMIACTGCSFFEKKATEISTPDQRETSSDAIISDKTPSETSSKSDESASETQPTETQPNDKNVSDNESADLDRSMQELQKTIKTYEQLIRTLFERDKTMSKQISDLEATVRQTIIASQTNIGGYAVNYVDSVLNLVCEDDRYLSVSDNESLTSGGTGFIITDDGYVLTNNHVVTYSRVTVWDGTPTKTPYGMVGSEKLVSGEYKTITGYFDAASRLYDNCKGYTLEIIYRDPEYDLALCKLATIENKPSWKPIPFFDGEIVRGNQVLVLGNAAGYGLSATAGLISATGKTDNSYEKLTFLQTDAAVNGGNSGGPILNIYGGIVGITKMKFVGSSIDNIAFGIEVDKVKEFIAAAETIKEIEVSYKSIGITEADPLIHEEEILPT